ncbi:TetR/AcrR family transcriptional regulator [Pontibacter sp. JAM-7]|uniref:TetR/AcrR family transcriptional regulator n=1 Tax=Pontibacter sp. JAM-7 TaxID=3366581 RepID=UPI003AF91313
MARRNDHSREELQSMALTAAERLLDEQGAAALSARKVAAEIGYSAGALYLVFTNRDDLCWQLNARTLEKLLLALREVSCRQPIQCLQQYAETYLAFASRWSNRWSLLFEHRSPDGTEAPVWLSEKIELLFRCLEQPLSGLFPHARSAEIGLMARTLWSGVHGVTILQLRDKLFISQDASAEKMLDGLITAYVAGIQHNREVAV